MLTPKVCPIMHAGASPYAPVAQLVKVIATKQQ